MQPRVAAHDHPVKKGISWNVLGYNDTQIINIPHQGNLMSEARNFQRIFNNCIVSESFVLMNFINVFSGVVIVIFLLFLVLAVI